MPIVPRAHSAGNFIVQPDEGDPYFATFFKGERWKMVTVKPPDAVFQGFLASAGPRFRTAGFACKIYELTNGTPTEWSRADEFVVETFGFTFGLDANKVCAFLTYLGGEGSSILDIPEGAEKVNLILGYIEVGGVKFVLYVTHEHEAGEKEQIRLNAELLNNWDETDPLIVLITG